MNLQTIYDHLAYGELSNLAIGNIGPDGSITESSKRKLIPQIQLGLTTLYSRFRLRESEVMIKLHHNQNIYPLINSALADIEILNRSVINTSTPRVRAKGTGLNPFDGSHVYDSSNGYTENILKPDSAINQNADIANAHGPITDKTVSSNNALNKRSNGIVATTTARILKPIPEEQINEISSILTEEAPKHYLTETNGFEFDQDELLKIERVYDDLGNEVLLNKRDDPHSIRTPKKNIIMLPQVMRMDETLYHFNYQHTYNYKHTRGYPMYTEHCPGGRVTQALRVVYRANHPKIDTELALCDTSNVEEIELPETHLRPLLWFIASQVHTPTGMQNDHHAGNSHYAKYEQACKELEGQNYQIDNIGSQTKFEEAGWP